VSSYECVGVALIQSEEITNGIKQEDDWLEAQYKNPRGNWAIARNLVPAKSLAGVPPAGTTGQLGQVRLEVTKLVILAPKKARPPTLKSLRTARDALHNSKIRVERIRPPEPLASEAKDRMASQLANGVQTPASVKAKHQAQTRSQAPRGRRGVRLAEKSNAVLPTAAAAKAAKDSTPDLLRGLPNMTVLPEFKPKSACVVS
jgi:hypothetical protein